MAVTTQSAKTILRRQKKIDSWFISRYGMNLYRGCLHNCSYCDGRAEKYQVDGDFGRQVTAKVNAVEILAKEIASLVKRRSIKGGFFFVGGGVCDSYQPVESEIQLTRRALELLREHNLPVHLLTKSVLIERDFELIREINQQKRAVVSMSFSSMDDELSAVFEPGASPPSARLKTLARFKQAGVAVGIYLLPIIPYVTDSSVQLQRSFQSFKNIGADWVVCGGMTMKGGRQFEYFNKVLAAYDPTLPSAYQKLYPGEAWGNADAAYTTALNRRLVELAYQFQLPMRMPPRLWADLLDDNDLMIVFLEHIDYLLKTRGEKSAFGWIAYSLSKLTAPWHESEEQIMRLPNMRPSTLVLMRELQAHLTSPYYEWLMFGRVQPKV